MKFKMCSKFKSSDDYYNNKLAKQMVLNVLSETLDKLTILKHVNGWSAGDQTVVEYKTIEEQCNTIKNHDVLAPESKDFVDLQDFRRDCSFIESTIREAFEEIRKNGTFDGLKAITNIFHRLNKEETDLLEDTKRKEEEYLELQNIYYTESTSFRREIEEVMTKIGNLKDEIEDFEQEAAIKTKYLASWENSKAEISQYVLNQKEASLEEAIKERQHDFTKEDRVHQEIKNIFNEIEMDLQKQLKKWKLKYEYDLAAITSKITNLQDKKDQQQEKTAQMVKKYIQRQQEIDSYQEYKAEQEKKRLEKERKDKAATKIQAWWRGTMVRKGFGKYKKKKDKKGKKDKKK